MRAAEKVLAMGPKTLVVKHGEYGATAFFSDRSFRGAKLSRPFRAPALPLAEVVDPTGAGDSFAGGFYGYLASQPELDACGLSHGDVLRRRDGLVCGGAVRHGAAAEGDAGGDRRALQAIPGDIAS